ncbi:MAG: hypothetical protein CMI60_02155 [Parvibaculum sp.]|nr:hypothetical protein [Parvibaculum sp.]
MDASKRHIKKELRKVARFCRFRYGPAPGTFATRHVPGCFLVAIPDEKPVKSALALFYGMAQAKSHL